LLVFAKQFIAPCTEEAYNKTSFVSQYRVLFEWVPCVDSREYPRARKIDNAIRTSSIVTSHWIHQPRGGRMLPLKLPTAFFVPSKAICGDHPPRIAFFYVGAGKRISKERSSLYAPV
jgi:hypothetical protein